MTLKLERVDVARIKPLEDEYGNQFVSRDYELQANKDYVKALAESFGPGGEPDEPVKLIEDGDCYRIKAGNSRVRAMELLGTGQCWAIIDDEDTVQSVVETVVRTNTKKKYEPVEESRFVQQLAMFGDDEYVGTVASIGADNAGKLRRGRELAGDSASQLSLDRMYTLSEFEGYPDMVDAIVGSDEDEWRYTVSRLRRKKDEIEDVAAFTAKAAELKISLVEDRPDELHYISGCDDPDDLAGDYMAASVEYKSIVGRICRNWNGASVDLYGEPLHKKTESAEEAERRRLEHLYLREGSRIDDALVAWTRKNLDQTNTTFEKVRKTMPGLFAAAHDYMYESAYWVASAVREIPECKGYSISVLDFACFYTSAREMIGRFASDLAKDELPDFRTRNIEKWLDWVDLHMADGWEPDEAMTKLISVAAAKVGRAEEDGDGR